METYSKYLKYTTSGGLRNKELYKISNGLYVSQLPELSVADYIICKERNRNKLHNVNGGVSVCSKCWGLVSVVKEIQEKGMVKVSETLKKYFSGNTYSSEEAVRKFMSLPVVIFELGDASKRTQTLYMIERHAGVDYIKYVELLRSASGGIDTSCSSNSINKEKLKALCELASSEKDRKLIKYAMCGDFSNKTAKKYGLSDWNRQKDEIESSVERSKEIREAVIELACLEEKTVLRSYGIEIESDNESIISRESGESCDWNSEKESDSEGESEGGQTNSEREMADCRLDKHSEEYNFDPDRLQKESTPLISDVPSFDNLVFILRQNNLNWFSFRSGRFTTVISAILQRENVCSDSESDNPDEWIDVDLRTEAGKKLIQKERRRIRQKANQQAAKRVAEECLLRRKIPKRVGRVLRDYPDIGKEIENFVQSKRVGADAWRRTGILTFDGNVKQGQKVTYKRIKQHLEEKYNTLVMVRLCSYLL
ncbi:unnamed protein product [Porites evermanni]|uniref:Uncharacterized protein n=1 Tax=Porites evermanni TaxID=104178 RepID=A0ABN8MJD6_9CNID|nr:unnamed protein product [Porites evermanni]